MSSLTFVPPSSALKEELLSNKIRAFMAKHLGVSVDSISNEANLRDDLGLDLIDIIELMIVLENQFANGRSTDDANDIECVGDLIRCIENRSGVIASAESRMQAASAVGELAPPGLQDLHDAPHHRTARK